jgi:hypothetical protein
MGYDYDNKQKLPARRARVTDVSGDVGLSLQRPGFRIIDSASTDAKERAYQEYENELVNAWRPGAGGLAYRPPNHLHIAKSTQELAQDHETIDQIYAAYDKELANAWRKS